MPITGQLLPGVKDPVIPAYNVANSLRFNSGSSDYLNRTATSGNQRTFTFSCWFKLCDTATQYLGSQSSGSNSYMAIYIQSSEVRVYDQNNSNQTLYFRTNRLLRDFSAWYHLMVAVDTTQSTESNRVKIYINGVQETSFASSTYPSQNTDTNINHNGTVFQIGRYDYTGIGSPTHYLNSYLAETVLVDGSQLDQTSFGEFDSDSPNIWKPIDVSGLTFGTNGFYLDFEDSSSLGNDAAGSNNFTVNNLTATDQSTDTCTNNFATMNALDNQIQGATFSEGNLQVVTGASGYYSPTLSTIGVSQGKWYCEIELDTIGGSGSAVGVLAKQVTGQAIIGDDANGVAYLLYDGQKRTGGTSSSFGNTLANGDVVGIALDLDNNKVYFSKNGTFQASGDPAGNSNGISVTAPASTDTGFYFIGVQDVGNGSPGTTYKLNFGSPPYSISSGNADANGFGNFEYAVPSGYFAHCTKNLAEFG